MLRDASKRRIPIGRFFGIYFVSCLAVLLISLNLIASEEPIAGLVNNYCVSCHDGETKKGGLDLEGISGKNIAQYPDTWERVVRKLRARQMPPAGKKRPDEQTYQTVV